jgi:PKD repeat protein
MSILKKLALVSSILVAVAPTAMAQVYPLPGKSSNAPVLCTSCEGKNVHGQTNTGLKTWPYSSPLVNHTGRIVNSVYTGDVMSGANYGFRTARAKIVRIAKTQRGGAPPRAYIMIGSAMGAYSLDRFFTTTLPGGLKPITDFFTTAGRGDDPNEKIATWDAYVYPEQNAEEWTIRSGDGQDRMYDFDFDDRGYVYLAFGQYLGFGIVRDDGITNGNQMPRVAQVLTSPIDPETVITLKVGSTYYAVLASPTGRATYNVTDPANPTLGAKRPASDTDTRVYGVLTWAKDEARQRVAITTLEGKIEIYDYATLATGGLPIKTVSAPSGKKYGSVVTDDDGNFWTSDLTTSPDSSNALVKIDRSAGYSEHRHQVFGGPFTTILNSPGQSRSSVSYGDNYLTVVGRTVPGTQGTDVRLFKLEGGQPVAIDLAAFFANYYFAPPRDYAQPRGSDVGINYGAQPIRWNNKTYLIFNAHGLGDVFELQAGDSIAVTKKNGTFGAANPNAKSTATGPFYGDILKFNAKSSNVSFEYDVTWDFDNPDSGAANTVAARTNQDVTHQFTGLSSAAAIQTAKQVKATGVLNSGMADAVTVTLAVPTARIGVAGTNTAITTDGASLALVAGEALTDASDGEIEGHYSLWTLDNAAPVAQAPNLTLPVGAVGPHTVTLSAKYGKYDALFATVGAPYVDTVSTLSYVVRPFIVSFGATTPTGAAVTFNGTARKTSLTSVLAATSWTVEWSLKNGSTDIVPVQSSTVPVGQIPQFTVANKAVITSGSVLKLRVFVTPTELGTGVPAEYAEHFVTQTLVVPDPAIAKTGCANAGSPCTFTVSSLGGQSTAGWTVTWTLLNNSALVGTFTGSAAEPFTPTLTTSGLYTVSLVAATNVFEGPASLTPFQVADTICGNPPTGSQLAIYASCTSGCTAGVNITIRADMLGYNPTGCEEYIWNYGDGSTGLNQRSTTHAYASQGSYLVTLSVRKGTSVSPQVSKTITVGPVVIPCTAPSNITISYSGNKGCQAGIPCKTGESVRFTALRNNNTLSTSCDSASWTFGDGGDSGERSPNHTFTSTSDGFTVNVTVSNSGGSADGSIIVPVVADIVECKAPPTSSKVYLDYTGATSGCTKLNEKLCLAGEQIKFRPRPFLGSTIQDCDRFEWNFGDNGTSTLNEPTHVYAGGVASYHVTARVYNTANTTGNQLTVEVPFENAPLLQVPALSFASFSATGTKGIEVTFTVTSDIDAKGWSWNFGDGQTDTTQFNQVGKSSTVSHVYNSTGSFTVTVTARNSQDTTAKSQSQVDRAITIDETPEYRYLVPVVAHAGGQSDSVWRTDLQVYTPDSSVSSSSPLNLVLSYKGVNYPRNLHKSTYILPDVLADLLGSSVTEQGSMIISVKTRVAPQIWSRTYNQTPAGTFGQFVPAILLNEAGGGSAVGEGMYYLAGLKSDARYRTNVGLVNPNAQQITAIVRLYDRGGLAIGQPVPHILQPFQLEQFPVDDGSTDQPFSVEIEVPAGTWLIGYASFIDGGSNDPVYIRAIRASELGSADFRENVIPGVGHTGDWRSDVTVYNPNGRSVTVDLAYHDASGAKLAEVKNVPINAGQFLSYPDILRQGIFGTVADGVGIVRVTVPASVSADYFPMAFARTYNDNGTGKTFGQGIAGFAGSRANVKAGKAALIAGVRSDAKYYTNIGLINVSSSVATVTVRVLDPFSGLEVPGSARTHTLQPNQSIVGPQTLEDQNKVPLDNASLRIEATGGNVWAFASIIDKGTKDPEYVPATPLP